MKAFFAMMLGAAALLAADATGTWKGTLVVPAPEGAERTVTAYMVLKQEGAKLTGTAGPDEARQTPITNGKVDNGVITFEAGEGERVMIFKLKHQEDEITGEVSRNGEERRAKLAVKREK